MIITGAQIITADKPDFSGRSAVIVIWKVSLSLSLSSAAHRPLFPAGYAIAARAPVWDRHGYMEAQTCQKLPDRHSTDHIFASVRRRQAAALLPGRLLDSARIRYIWRVPQGLPRCPDAFLWRRWDRPGYIPDLNSAYRQETVYIPKRKGSCPATGGRCGAILPRALCDASFCRRFRRHGIGCTILF